VHGTKEEQMGNKSIASGLPTYGGLSMCIGFVICHVLQISEIE